MRPGKGPFVALLVVAVVANLPLLHHTWQQWRIDRDGVHVTAEVTATDVLREDHFVVRLRLPEDVDPEQRTWPIEVDRSAYERAEDSGEIGVTVLPDDPAAQRVDGERADALGWIIIGAVDLLLVLLGLLLWAVRRRMTSDVIAESTSDG